MTEATPSAPPSKLAGRLCILAAAVLWSSGGFFAQSPIFADWPGGMPRGMLLAFWRAVFASLILLPMVRRPRLSWRLIPLVLIFVAMNVTYLTALVKSEAALAIWLQNTASLWVFLFGVLVLRDPITRRDWLLVAFIALGVGLIVLFEAWDKSPEGFVFGLLGGLTYAGVLLCLRWLRDFDSAWLVAVAHVGTAVILSPWAIGSGHLPHGEQWLYLAGFGMLQMGIPYLLFARGLRSLPGHEASGIVLLEPILMPFWVWLAYHAQPSYEPPQWWTLLGGGLILCGLLVRYLKLRSRFWT
jgi:drug/metabolite transporter (DMT)-like permease